MVDWEDLDSLTSSLLDTQFDIKPFLDDFRKEKKAKRLYSRILMPFGIPPSQKLEIKVC
jgi:hypothetical protein